MTPCRNDEKISALIDGELSGEEERKMLNHLEACAGCHAVYDDLSMIQKSVAAQFSDAMSAAPKAPASAVERRSIWTKVASGVGLAAAAGMAWALFLRQESIEATPLGLLELAAEQHQELRDVEVYATVKSGLFELFAKISGKKKREPKAHFRAIVRKPGQVLLYGVDNLGTREPEKDGEVMGYDGDKFWQYDRERGVVRRGGSNFEFRSGGSTMTFYKEVRKKGGLLRYLSWDFVQTLAGEAGKNEIVEVTGPAHRRTGRRVFRLQARETGDGKAQWVWDQTEITIDPRTNLVERMVFNVELAGVNMLRVDLQLSEVNNGYRDAHFDYRRFVPPGTPVVDEPKKPADEKKPDYDKKPDKKSNDK